MSQTLPYWLLTLYMYGLKPSHFIRWIDTFSSIEKLFKASIDELTDAGVTTKYIKQIKSPAWHQVEKDLAWLNASSQHHLIAFDDPLYPPMLKTIAEPPLLLYVHGNPKSLSKPQIGIVGSRHATHQGITNATQFAYDLAKAGLVVTSGLALGIDGAAHRGVIDAQGVTNAILGAGVDVIYPKAHQRIAEQIIAFNGAVISEFPLSTQPKPMHFPRRNRIIAGLSQGILVIEAAMKSGSLITARLALEEGREVFAIPGSIHHPLSRGCHYLIKQGAKLVENSADIFEEFTLSYQALAKPDANDALPAKNKQILEQIDYEHTAMDMILLRSRLTAGEVSSILLALELDGYIRTVTGGYIRIR